MLCIFRRGSNCDEQNNHLRLCTLEPNKRGVTTRVYPAIGRSRPPHTSAKLTFPVKPSPLRHPRIYPFSSSSLISPGASSSPFTLSTPPTMSTPVFDRSIVERATSHMNEDHADGNLYIVQAFIDPAATSATMTDLDHKAGTWEYVVNGEMKSGSAPWSKEISERVQIRVEVVALYKQACEKLGIEVTKATHCESTLEGEGAGGGTGRCLGTHVRGAAGWLRLLRQRPGRTHERSPRWRLTTGERLYPI